MGNARKHNHARRRNRSSKVSVKRDPRRALLAGLPPELRARWDARRTLSQNYAALGLAAHVSAPADVKKHAPGLLSGALGGAVTVEWMDLPEAAEVSAKVAAVSRNHLRPEGFVSDEDVTYAAALRRAHPGAGPAATAAMARDIATNWRQLTREKIDALLARVRAQEERLARECAAEPSAAAASAAALAAAPVPASLPADAPAAAPAAGRRRGAARTG